MKGGNLSQLNDYAMTHPACGECKHCEMHEKDHSKFNLKFNRFELRLQTRRFLQVTDDCSAVYRGDYEICWCQGRGGIPGILNVFPTEI